MEGDWEGMDGGIRVWLCLRYVVNMYENFNKYVPYSISEIRSAVFLIMPILSNTLSIHLKMAGKSFEMCGNKSKIFKWRYTM